ncbi:phospholipase A2-like [Halichoeres trimaculatus]|uniref:phospholipase A2-like n=1 Tax=Halichoeres trimaculatus TaxID=147232 RepID=UPI003D9E8B62
MAALHQILQLLTVALVSVAARESQLTKRDLFELAETIECSTGKSALPYTVYGCYCGQGGQGKPLDDTDWCCFRHDCCYGEAERLGCKTKTDSYHWLCKDHTPECEDLEDQCKKLICECDRDIAECLKKAEYHITYALYPNVFCEDDPPPCQKKTETQDSS